MTDELPPPPTALLAALWDGDRDAALAAIAAGADVTVPDGRPVIGHGTTALHLAAAADDAGLVRALLAAGAAVDARTMSGQTPLWWACNGGAVTATRILLAAGAAPNIRCIDGYSPLGRVLSSDADMVELMRSHGGEV